MLGLVTGEPVDHKFQIQYNNDNDMLEDKYMTMKITEVLEPRDDGFLAEDVALIQEIAENPEWSPAQSAEDFLAEMAQWQ